VYLEVHVRAEQPADLFGHLGDHVATSVSTRLKAAAVPDLEQPARERRGPLADAVDRLDLHAERVVRLDLAHHEVSLDPRITVTRLLKSCAIPPASRAIAP
jgi:hypothetical protein